MPRLGGLTLRRNFHAYYAGTAVPLVVVDYANAVGDDRFDGDTMR